MHVRKETCSGLADAWGVSSKLVASLGWKTVTRASVSSVSLCWGCIGVAAADPASDESWDSLDAFRCGVVL